ncbi:MAG: hypothetical protein PHY73_03495 [Candidatus Omnitrophica bacterium]|nr:hypothetical protein [Candidatus Omnitrophota bacterium]
MSIINEALKKTQSVLERQKHSGDPAQKDSFKKDPWVKIAMLVIVGGFFGCAVVLSTILLSTNHASKPTFIEHTNILPPANQNTTSEKKIISSSGLNLNGIMKSGDHYTALINAKIVQQGDAIGDKKVLAITEDSVKIFNQGEVFVLKLNP